jgi:feruloyl-CoA synthase
MKFVDADDPNKGMRFDGRISEDFKLQTGTWVRASSLRLEVLTCLAPLAADVIITGQDRVEIGVMIFPNHDAIREADYDLQSDKGAMNCELLLSDIARRLTEFEGRSSGSSTRVARALVLAEPPSIADGEITAKGNLNFRKVITGRADLLERLYDDSDPATIKIL